MNLARLKQAEQDFLARHPFGFHDPELQLLARKHRMEAMTAQAQAAFAPECFAAPLEVVQSMVRCVSRSSMVSLFEKPKFRDFVASLGTTQYQTLADGLHGFLHGDQQRGFETMTSVLASGGLAKWSLLTVIPNYYAPDKEVFIKPTTAKGVIEWFCLEGLHYSPKPSWGFYQQYRKQFLAMRKKVSKSLAPSNAAFGGFLMMSMQHHR